MGESNEQKLLRKLEELIAAMRESKPSDRSDVDRVYAVTLTELEKVRAYWLVTAVRKE